MDLDLSKHADLEKLYRRIRFAARRVCSKDISIGEGRALSELAACYRATLDNTVAHLNRPALTALHRATMSVTDRTVAAR